MAEPNNPISGFLGPLADYSDQQVKMQQASKMLMGKHMLDQNTAASSRRFDTLNANITGYETRRKDLETHKWNMLNALIDPQGDAFQGQQRSSILKQLGFDENTYQVMLGSLNTDLRAIDRVLQSNYQLRNETYGFGKNQGVNNIYAGGGTAGGGTGGGTGAPAGEEAFLKHLQQGGAGAAVTKTVGDEDQDGEGFDLAGAVKTAADAGKAMVELGKGYKIWVQDPDNFVNKAFKEGLINPNSNKNYALAVYRKALSLLPEGASEEQIQEFWLAPGLQDRLKEIIEAGRNDKKSFDSWISERLSPFDKYFKKLGGFSDDIGLTEAWNKSNLWLGDQFDTMFPHDAPATASPSAAAPSSATPSSLSPRSPLGTHPGVEMSWHPDFDNPPGEGYSGMRPRITATREQYNRYLSDRDRANEFADGAVSSEAPLAPIPSGDLSGTPSPDYFGTGQLPAQDRMDQWQQFVTDMGLPWDPLAVPTGIENTFSDRGIDAYQRNLEALGAGEGASITEGGEISVVPTYEVFQQRLAQAGSAALPSTFGAQSQGQSSPTGEQSPAAMPQLMNTAGTGQAPGMMDEFQGAPPMGYAPTGDPMGGGVGQPTMNQQTVPMAPMGGTEGVMSGIEEGAMNPFITPGQPQGSAGPPRDPYAPPSLDGRVPPETPQGMGFGMDTWYQPAMDIGGPSGDPFTTDDTLVAGDVGGPGEMILTPEERTDRSKREFEELASRVGSFTGETLNDFIDWGMDQANPTTIAAIAGAGGGSYFLGKTIRNSAFDSYNKSVEAYNKARAKGTPARTTITQAAADVKELDNMEKVKKKDGRSLSKTDQDKLDNARDNLRNKKSIAWKDFMKKQAKRASWIGLGGAVIYGLSTEAFGMDNVDRQIGLVLDDNKKAQFALDAILKVNPISLVQEMHQQGKQSIPTLRKERHTGPEMFHSPGLLGAGGGRREGYPLHLFPNQGLNSGAPQVQAMMSELEKKNQ